MAACDLLDFRCLFVSELVGNTLLATILVIILYFIIAAKSRFGFDTTIAFGLPLMLIFGLMMTGFTAMFAFVTLMVALLIAWLFNIITGNK